MCINNIRTLLHEDSRYRLQNIIWIVYEDLKYSDSHEITMP